MKTFYHRQITQAALETYFGPAALERVITANLGQDALQYQVGHDHFHYDNNAFAAGDAYMEAQRAEVFSALQTGRVDLARAAFGRLTHTAQDFYAHSNYVSLWRAAHGSDAPETIDPLDETLRQHPGLHSGKLYYPLEVFSFIPALEPLVTPRLPPDSHARMNQDHPGRPHFQAAWHAAVRRTRYEFHRLAVDLTPDQHARFTGLAG